MVTSGPRYLHPRSHSLVTRIITMPHCTPHTHVSRKCSSHKTNVSMDGSSTQPPTTNPTWTTHGDSEVCARSCISYVNGSGTGYREFFPKIETLLWQVECLKIRYIMILEPLSHSKQNIYTLLFIRGIDVLIFISRHGVHTYIELPINSVSTYLQRYS